MTSPDRLHVATFDQIPSAIGYALLRLRVDVFVVEQACAYPELDGRDLEPGAWHLWLTGHVTPHGDARPVGTALVDTPLAYLRILEEPDGGSRIGRVCVSATARRRGRAERLMVAALERVGQRRCVLSAQSHLVGFYARFGFTVDGDEYLEDGIAHLPMTRG